MRIKRLVKWSVFFGLLSVLAIWVSGWLVERAARGRTHDDPATLEPREVGLLLGCSARVSDGQPNIFFIERIEAAARLIRERKIKFLIASGDNHIAGYDEPTDMKSALIRAGVPAESIFCDYAGFRTLDSVVRAREVFGQNRLVIISQEFHNQRAIYIASRMGIDAIGFNAADVASRQHFRPRIRELFARVKTVLDVCLLGTRPKFLGPRIQIPPPSGVGVAGGKSA